MTLESYLEQTTIWLVEDLNCVAVVGDREFFVRVVDVDAQWMNHEYEAFVSLIGQDLDGRETVIAFDGSVWKQPSKCDATMFWNFEPVRELDGEWTVVVMG